MANEVKGLLIGSCYDLVYHICHILPLFDFFPFLMMCDYLGVVSVREWGFVR